MIEPSDSSDSRARTLGIAGLVQILGFAGTSHLLYAIAARLPGFEASSLAGATALAARTSPGDLGQALWSLAVVPAVVEELLFRGLAFAAFDRIGGTRVAIGASALLFGLAHLDLHSGLRAGPDAALQYGLQHALVALLLGIQLGALRQVHGLAWAIAAHLFNNGLAVAAAALAVRDDALSAHAWSAAGSLISLPIALALSGIACAALAQRLRSAPPIPPRATTDLQTVPETVD